MGQPWFPIPPTGTPPPNTSDLPGLDITFVTVPENLERDLQIESNPSGQAFEKGLDNLLYALAAGEADSEDVFAFWNRR